MNPTTLARLAALAAAALPLAVVQAQSSTTPTDSGRSDTQQADPQRTDSQGKERNEQETFKRDMPPGATEADGNKGAVPARTGDADTNPTTGSTPGIIPAQRAPEGDKARTPKTDGDGADNRPSQAGDSKDVQQGTGAGSGTGTGTSR